MPKKTPTGESKEDLASKKGKKISLQNPKNRSASD
jgi:hypothetical protein